MSPQRKFRQCLHSAPSGVCLRCSARLSAPCFREDPIDPYLATPWHPSLDPPTPALADIFNSFLRHPRRPSLPHNRSATRSSVLTRPPSGCLIFRLSRFNSPTVYRRIIKTYIPAKSHSEKRFTLANKLNILISSHHNWFR